MNLFIFFKFKFKENANQEVNTVNEQEQKFDITKKVHKPPIKPFHF